MAHIGEELRFVLACDLKLPALVLDFVEQPHVFDRDHRLVGEGLDQLDLLAGKRPYDRTQQQKYADRVSLAQQRHSKHRAKAGSLLNFNHGVFRIG